MHCLPALQVVVWEVTSHRQPSAACSHAEDGGTIKYAVWLAGAAAAAAPAAVCYSVNTAGSAMVTLKCLDHTGAVSVVQVRAAGTLGCC